MRIDQYLYINSGADQTIIRAVQNTHRLDYLPLFGKMSQHSSPERGEDQRPDPGDGGNRA